MGASVPDAGSTSDAGTHTNTRLTRNPAFLCFLAARAQSQVGSAVTATATPLIAATWLGADPTQMGMLVSIPFIVRVASRLLSAFAAERPSLRLPAIMTIDAVAGLMTGAIVLTAITGNLSMAWLIALSSLLAGLTGAFGSFSLPLMIDIVDREQLTRANGATSAASQLSTIIGPGVLGVLAQFLALPLILIIDAVTYLLSITLMLALRRIKTFSGPPGEAPRAARTGMRGFLHAFRNGIRFYVSWGAVISFMNGAIIAWLPIYAIRDLQLSPDLYAFILAAGAVGGVAGSSTTSLWEAKLGRRRAALSAAALTLGATGCLAFVNAGMIGAMGCLGYELLGSFGGTVFVVLMMSSIPTAVPENAIAKSMAVGALVLELGTAGGAALGGAVGSLIGIRSAVEACFYLGIAILLVAGLRGLRTRTTPHGASFRRS
ncbi:MFS transporter [Streptosporangium canum]|uniref:MFS transporter n=1 Tax=Streptosporangium canum TaxID=324952 RepID=UPI00378999A0